MRPKLELLMDARAGPLAVYACFRRGPRLIVVLPEKALEFGNVRLRRLGLNKYDDLFRLMEQEMERMSQDALQQVDRLRSRGRIWQPPADVCETRDAVVVTVDLAGMSAESIGQRLQVILSTDGKSLIVAGKRDEPSYDDERLRCYQLEIYYGGFERRIPLPAEIILERENLVASYKDGLLKVVLPKRPPEPPRTIVVENRG